MGKVTGFKEYKRARKTCRLKMDKALSRVSPELPEEKIRTQGALYGLWCAHMSLGMSFRQYYS